MTSVKTLADLEAYIRAHGFELLVTINKRGVTAILRRKPPLRSFIGRGESLLAAIEVAIGRADANRN